MPEKEPSYKVSPPAYKELKADSLKKKDQQAGRLS